MPLSWSPGGRPRGCRGDSRGSSRVYIDFYFGDDVTASKNFIVVADEPGYPSLTFGLATLRGSLVSKCLAAAFYCLSTSDNAGQSRLAR